MEEPLPLSAPLRFCGLVPHSTTCGFPNLLKQSLQSNAPHSYGGWKKPKCWMDLGGRQCALPCRAPAEASCAHTFHLPAWWEVPALSTETWERLLALPAAPEIKFCILQWCGRKYRPATLAPIDTRTLKIPELYQQRPCLRSHLPLAASFCAAGAWLHPALDKPVQPGWVEIGRCGRILCRGDVGAQLVRAVVDKN